MARTGRLFLIAAAAAASVATTTAADRPFSTASRASVHRRRPAAVVVDRADAVVDRLSAPKTDGEDYVASRSNGGALSTTTTSPPPRGGGVLPSSQLFSELSGVAFFVLAEYAVRILFASRGIKFPSALGSCLLLFGLSCVLRAVNPAWGDAAFEFVNPGAVWLARWMTVFFVPGLALLPLAPSFGGSVEVIKVLGVVVIGFAYSLFTTAYAVLGLRSLQGAIVTPEEAPTEDAAPAAPATAPAKPYSQETLDLLIKGTVLSGAISIAATRAGHDLKTPLQTLFMTLVTVASYVWGARLPAAFNKVVHPLITCTVLILIASRLTGMATGASFEDVLGSYRSGTLDPMTTGTGDLLLYMLGPTVASFSVSMYTRRTLMAQNLFIILASTLVSSVGGLFGTAFFVRLIALGGKAGSVLRLSMLPRNVTTALAIAIANIIGGDISLTASAVVLTGILGATVGARVLDAAGIKDPVTRGLGVGGSAQGLGVAAFVNEKDAFPFAAVSMVMTAVAATCLVSVPSIKDMLVSICADVAEEVAEAAAEAAA